MDARFKCHDIVDIHLRAVPAGIYERLIHEFPSYISLIDAGSADKASTVIEFVPKLTLPPKSRFITRRAAYTDTAFYLRDARDGMIQIDAVGPGSLHRFQVSRNIEWALFVDFLETLLHTFALQRGKAFFHSGAIGIDGKGVVLCSWANTGKTDAVIEFLKRKYAYIGDDWSILGADGYLYSYDKAVAMYTHDIAVSPDIAKDYYGKLKGQIVSRYCRLISPSKVYNSSAPMAHRIERRILREVINRLHIKIGIHADASRITPSGTLHTSPLRLVYFMSRSNIGELSFAPLDSDALIARMLPCYRFERRLFLDSDMLEFAFPGQAVALSLKDEVDLVKSIWSQALARPSVKIFSIDIPVETGSAELTSHLEAHAHTALA